MSRTRKNSRRNTSVRKERTWWENRKLKKKGVELSAELRYMLKRFGNGRKPLFYWPWEPKGITLSSHDTDRITLHLKSWQEALAEKEDLEPVTNHMEELVRELKSYRRNAIASFVKSVLLAASVALFFRAFIFEPFRIPSGSMIPTLQVGDYIYVNKSAYGLRVPFTDHPPKQFAQWSLPTRGDIIVFIEPLKNSEDWIKRVVGLPGDVIRFHNRTIYIKKGGKGKFEPIATKKLEEECSYMDKNEKLGEDWHPGKPCDIYEEKMGGHTYNVIYDKYPRPLPSGWPDTWKVPPGCVFVMGDNRDNSEDSRFLMKDNKAAPCIPLVNIKGKAEFIWLSLGHNGPRWKRMFSGIH